MDEREFRDQMLRLAEPIAATSKAVNAVATRVQSKRRSRALAITAIGVLAAISGLVAHHLTGSNGGLQPTGSRDGVKISTYVDQGGIRLQMSTVFPDDREITAGRVEVGDATGKATIYAQDGTDPEAGPPVPLPLSAGVLADVEARVQPNCAAGMPDRIAFVITSRLTDGSSVVDRYSPGSTEFYESAYRIWCHVGVGIQIGGGGLDEDQAFVAVRVVNSTSSTVTFEMPAVDANGVKWNALTATVPAHDQKSLTAIGEGFRCGENLPVPWANGRILVNGQPYDVPVSDVWC